MTIHGQKQNKGEWAEFYVFLKLLGDRKLYAANKQLQKKPDSYLEVLKILREEISGLITWYSTQGQVGYIEIYKGNEFVLKVLAKDFSANAEAFFKYLKDETGKLPRNGSIPAPKQICDFADLILVNKPKSPAVKSFGSFGGKNDITIVLRDPRNSLVTTSGFSIKSQFSSPPTLFNAGGTSQMLYRLDGINESTAKVFNSFEDNKGHREWNAAIKFLNRENIKPIFIGTQHKVYSDNLLYIRETMEKILGWVYQYGMLQNRSVKGIAELCEIIEKENPFGFSQTTLYEKAIKDFLYASFSGMTAGRCWDGTEQVNGGYIVVKDDGEVLCYHANDRENFRDYLFRQTYLEYVSCKKFKWGYIFKKGNSFFLPINASIRFYKS